MSKHLLLSAAMLSLSLICLVPRASPQTSPSAAAETGTIEGTVVREGTTEPIPDVQITLGAGPALGARQAQAILDAAASGAPGIPEELLRAAQDALRAGAGTRGTVSVPITVTSDSAGHFVIHNVPAGNTVMRAQIPGYFGSPIDGIFAASASASVTVAAQKTTRSQIALIPGAVVTGRVLDPAGKPLADAAVQLLQPVYQNGVRTVAIVDLKPTDDRGEYRLSRFPPGEYYLAATPVRPPTSSAPEIPVTTVHPNAIDMAIATPVVLHAGEELSAMNIQVRTAPSAKVSGKVTSLLPSMTGQRGANRPSLVMLVPRNPAALPDLAGATVTMNASDGAFEFPRVPPGSYELFARLPVASFTGWGAGNAPALAANPWAFGRISVEVQGQNVNDLSIVVRNGTDISGHLIVDGKPATANVRIGLQLDESIQGLTDAQSLTTFGQIAMFQPSIGADGSFMIPLVPEGRYRFLVGLGGVVSGGARGQAAEAPAPALPATTYVADIRQGGASIYDSGVVVGSQGVSPIEVLVNTNGGSIAGNVLRPDRKAAATVTVALVPAETRRRNPALYRHARTDSQGRFQFEAIPPGQYKLFAWENVPAGAWQNAEFLARYEQRGIALTVTSGTRAAVEVESIGEGR